jgi:hypothetical protein
LVEVLDGGIWKGNAVENELDFLPGIETFRELQSFS